jgi:aryl-alcohol dehydrogenase-like predicted oxidoreductase
MLPGNAEPDLTARFTDRFQPEKSSGFYRAVQGLEVSSVGIGSYLGDLDEETDNGYAGSIVAAVRGGINFIDTSLNYRNQRSEISLGRGIHQLTGAGELHRGEFAICTKAGYLVPEAVPALNPADVAGRMHCMTPDFLSDQLERSRTNLGLETIDVFYLHNPETQLKFLARDEFDQRIRAAFELLEQRVREGKICFYGAATWDGFRKPAGHPEGLSLTRMAEIAKAVAGDQHHFRFIQLPVNLAMGEAMGIRNETVDGKPVTVLEAAAHLGISVVASASLLQARLARNLPDEVAKAFPGMQTDAQRALQFSRSVPGVSVALVGMSNTAHVKENLTVARVPSVTRQNFLQMFQREG